MRGETLLVDRVSVVGLGKLGLPFAVALADRGFKVIGVDNNEAVIDGLLCAESHVYEPGLEDMLRDVRNDGQFLPTNDLAYAVEHSDVTFILVPTPSTGGYRFDNRYVLQVCGDLGPLLAAKEGYHVIVISSTVMPGSCEGEIAEELTRTSGLELGEGYGLCYCPEFIALGEAIKGFQSPDFVLIGENDARAGDVIASLYREFCENLPPILRRDLVNAEIAKISVNFAVCAKISLANTLANVCERIPGGHVDQVTTVLGHDSRIGPAYLTGATAFGGTCFPRDVRAMLTLKPWNGLIQSSLAMSVKDVNLWQNDHLIDTAREYLATFSHPSAKVGILGLTFKSNTDVTEESVGMVLLGAFGLRAVVFDPVVACCQSVLTAQACVDRSSVVVATVREEVYRGLEYGAGHTVIDCWRQMDADRIRASGARYVGIGIGLP